MSNNLPKCEPSKRFLFELIFNGATMKTIYKVTGRSKTYIKKKLREYDLPTLLDLKKTLREMWKKRIAVEYMRLNGINNIASRTPFTRKTVTDILNGMGILTDLHLGGHIMKKRLESGWKPHPPHLQQVLEGEMLSDGWLSLNDIRTPSFNRLINEDDIINALDDLQWFSWVDVETEPQKLKDAISLFNITRETLSYLQGAYYGLEMASYAARWVEYVANQFRENGYYVNIYFTKPKWIDEDGVKHSHTRIQTESSLSLYIEWLRWYGLIKGVPWNFELTPTSLVHWFMGDGCFGNEITFSTQSFHWSEVEFLVCQLREKVGVRAKLSWRPDPRRDKAEAELPNLNRDWVITVPANRTSRTRFFDYLSMAQGIKIAREIMPWKFSRYLQKQDCV